MTKEQKIWFKSIIFVIGLLFWVYALLTLIDCTSLAKALPADTPSVIKGTFSATAIFGWLIYLLSVILGLTTFIFSFFKQKELKYLKGILIIILTAIFVVSLIIILALYGATQSSIKSITSSNAEEVLAVSMFVSVCINVFILILPSMTAFIVAPIITDFNKELPDIDISENDEITNMEEPEEFEQKLIEEKIREAEKKLKTKELELKYKEVLRRLNSIEEEVNVETKAEKKK